MERRTLLKAILGLAIAPKALAAKSQHTPNQGTWHHQDVVWTTPTADEKLIQRITLKNAQAWMDVANTLEQQLWG